MPVALSYPGVYIEEVPSGVRTITGVATSIALFIGWAARGPTERAVRLTSFVDYERQFGGLDLRTLLGYAVKQFYDNGGADVYVIRLAHTDAVAASGASGVAIGGGRHGRLSGFSSGSGRKCRGLGIIQFGDRPEQFPAVTERDPKP